METETKLAPCPFCGKSNICDLNLSQEGYQWFCTDCGGMSPVGECPDECSEKWNKRPSEEYLKGCIKRMVRMFIVDENAQDVEAETEKAFQYILDQGV